MLIHDIIRMQKDKLLKKSESQATTICSGAAADYAEYRSMCGRLRGHQDAVDAIDEVMTNLNEESDD